MNRDDFDDESMVGDIPGLIDFVKGHPHAVLEGWAEKMKRDGGEHPFAWCMKHAPDGIDDKEAFCGAVHQRAFGMTPSEKKSKKLGK